MMLYKHVKKLEQLEKAQQKLIMILRKRVDGLKKLDKISPKDKIKSMQK
jgi:hypothetical protein